MSKYEEDYLTLGKKIISEGIWVTNERTGVRCKTLVAERIKFSGASDQMPLLTTKQSFPVSAVAEILGYLRKYTNAQQFTDIGSPTWHCNANETKGWLANPCRVGHNDLGPVYGASMVEGELEKVYNNLLAGIDDRGETLDFWKPETFHKVALRPCMRHHTFSLLEGTMHLTSESRSVDFACGSNFNHIQSYFLLNVMAHLTGHKVGIITHNMTNVHIYAPHLKGLQEQFNKTPLDNNLNFSIKGWVENLGDITKVSTHAREYFSLTGYNHLGKIPFDLIA